MVKNVNSHSKWSDVKYTVLEKSELLAVVIGTRCLKRLMPLKALSKVITQNYD